MKAFAGYHPIVLFTYFAAVIGFTMFFSHPVYLLISFISAVLLVAMVKGAKDIAKSLFFSLPMFVFIALLNPFFSHDGLTILFFLNNKPITLEAVLSGVSVAIMIIAVLYWFSALNEILTSDKIIFLFGKIAPAIALLLTMTLRLVPKAKQQLKKIRNAQVTMGMDESTGSVGKRIKSGMRSISILITWMLENGVDTADSMRARGYGLYGRKTYHSYRFQKRDGMMLSVILLLSAIILFGILQGINQFSYYPTVSQIHASWEAILCYVAFFLLTFLPLIIQQKEEIKWHYLQSKI